MLIDSHAHIPHNKEQAKEQIDNAKRAGVQKIITIGTSLAENEKAIELANEFDEIYAVIGIYPHSDTKEELSTLIETLEQQLKKSNKIVGIGECGIDITEWVKERPLNEQMELFEMQIQLAIKHNLPIVIHNRNGDEYILRILKKYEGKIKGVVHCFDSDVEAAKEFISLGFYISFSGFLTYNSKSYLVDVLKDIPIERVLIETDSPYIIPKGVKSKQNEPKNVRLVGQKVATIKNEEMDKIEKILCENTSQLFNL